jgi:type I restriction enzyme S subunit
VKNGWRELPLENILQFNTGKLDSNEADENGAYPFFTCSPETLRINTYAFDTEAVLLAGNNANGIFPVKYYKGKFNAYQRTYVVTPLDSKTIDCKYAYYQIVNLTKRLTQHSIGTATRFLTKSILHRLEIPVPSLPIQRRIAYILGALDDKIECNRRINQTLEAMAQALYKHWFVDIESRELPDEWEDTTVGDLCEFAYGKGLKEKERIEGQYPVYGSAGIVGTHNEYLVQAPGIVVGRKGTIGKVNRARLPFFPIDTTFYIVPKATEYSFEFLYLMLSRLELDKRNNDSAVPGLNRNDVYKLPTIKPPKTILEKFTALVAPLFMQIDGNENENQTLTRTRDYLLPKLLSGEVEVKQVEKQIAETA